MKASELIQKLLELTQEAGKDLDVVYDVKPAYDYGYNDDKNADWHNISEVSVENIKILPDYLDNNYEKMIVIDKDRYW